MGTGCRGSGLFTGRGIYMVSGTLRRHAPIMIIPALLLLSGCGGGGTSPSPAASKLAFAVQPTATAAGGPMDPALKVAVQNSSGISVSSATDPITLVLGSNPGGGTLSGTMVVNAVSGVGTFSDLAISAPGVGYTLVASSGTLLGATSSPFNVFGPATQISLNAGNNQLAAVSTAVTTRPSVIVRDAGNVPVPGVPVTFAVASGGGAVSPTTPVNTDQNGISAVTSWIVGPGLGQNTLTATASGLAGSPLTFTATGLNIVTINVVNTQFQPATTTVTVGTTVRWVWASGAGPHNVAPDASEPPRSGSPVSAPFSYEHTFDTPGTYLYHCEVHGGPGGVGMSGTITVQ
jgi:plastocyanin